MTQLIDLKRSTKAIQESLDLLQEEAGELVVEISKCRRFGLDSPHYLTGVEHRKMLVREIVDILVLVDILKDQGLIDPTEIGSMYSEKINKLKRWSDLFNKSPI